MFEKYENLKKFFIKPIPLYEYYHQAGAYHITKKQAWYALQIMKQEGHVTIVKANSKLGVHLIMPIWKKPLALKTASRHK